MSRSNAIRTCVAAILVGGCGLIDLFRHMPFVPHAPSSLWSAWFILIWLCLIVGGIGCGLLLDTLFPSWEDIDIDDE